MCKTAKIDILSKFCSLGMFCLNADLNSNHPLQAFEVSRTAHCEGAASRPNEQVPILQYPEDADTLYRAK